MDESVSQGPQGTLLSDSDGWLWAAAVAFCFDLRAVAVPFVLRNVASTRCLRVGNGCRKARADRGHTMWMGLGEWEWLWCKIRKC